MGAVSAKPTQRADGEKTSQYTMFWSIDVDKGMAMIYNSNIENFLIQGD